MTTYSQNKHHLRRQAAQSTQRSETQAKQYSLRFVVLMGIVFVMAGILLSVFFMRLRRHAPQIIVSVNGYNIDRTNFTQRLEMAAGSATLRDMVNEELYLQFACKKGVAPDEKEVKARFARAARQPDFLLHLQQNHQSPELYKRRIRVQLAKVAIFTRGVQVTDAEVQKYYQSQIAKNDPAARYYTPETIQVQVIITANEAQAQKAWQALNAAVPFDQVAERYSTDPNRMHSGLIPPFQRGRTKASRVPGLEAAIFSLKIGERWGPRRFGNLWWIVHCLDKTSERTIPYKEVQDECRTGALIARAMPINGRQVSAEFDEFKHSALIQTFASDYESAVSVK